MAATVTSKNLGSVAVGSSTSATLTFSFSTSATVGSIKVVTQGTEGLDFLRSATPGTCTVGTAYGVGQTCTVNVAFTPKGIGQRLGAALLYDNASTPNLVPTTDLAGTGTGGLPNFTTTQRTVGSGFSYPYGAIAIKSSVTLKALAVATNYLTSAMRAAAYTIK